MNRINEIGDTPRGQKALGAVFARAHNRKNWCDKNMVEPYRKDAKDYWQNVEHNASSEVGRNAKDKLKGYENFGDGAQEYYKNHLPNDTIQIPQHESKNGNMNKKLIRLTESDLHIIVKESVQKVLNEAYDYSLRNALPRDLNGIVLRVGDRVTYYNRSGNYDTIPYRIGGTIDNIEKTDEGDGFIVTIQTKKCGRISTKWAKHDIEKDNNSNISHHTDDLSKQITNVLFPH